MDAIGNDLMSIIKMAVNGDSFYCCFCPLNSGKKPNCKKACEDLIFEHFEKLTDELINKATDKLHCCGNCKHGFEDSMDGVCCKIHEGAYFEKRNCEKWELKED